MSTDDVAVDMSTVGSSRVSKAVNMPPATDSTHKLPESTMSTADLSVHKPPVAYSGHMS